MKLPIKQKYLVEIKSGNKIFEYRDAHITFVCEETGEKVTKKVIGARYISKQSVPSQYRHIIEDDFALEFELDD